MGSSAKVLRLWIGYDLNPIDLCREVELKYSERLHQLNSLPASWPFKIVILNVFLRSLWSYLNRHIMVPEIVRRRIENRDLNFMSRVPYFALGTMSQVVKEYSIRSGLSDFQLANVAGLIATARRVEERNGLAARVLQASTVYAGASRHPLRPSTIFATAFALPFRLSFRCRLFPFPSALRFSSRIAFASVTVSVRLSY